MTQDSGLSTQDSALRTQDSPPPAAIPFEAVDAREAPSEFSPLETRALYPMVAPLRAGLAIRIDLDGHEDPNTVLDLLDGAPGFFSRLGLAVHLTPDLRVDWRWWIVPITARPASAALVDATAASDSSLATSDSPPPEAL